MPGLPLLARETTFTQSRMTDQMCRQQSRGPLTAEESLAAEESLTIYCKPVELYNILQRRAIRNLSFLQRCLHYKIQAKRKRRIHMTVSLSGKMNVDIQMQNTSPLYVILARSVADGTAKEQSAVYRVHRTCKLTSFSEFGMKDQTEASFIIPGMKNWSANDQVGDLTVILASNGDAKGASGENCLPGDHDELGSIPAKLGGNCFWGKIPIESLCSSLEKSVTWNLDHRAEMISTIDMHPTILKPSLSDKDNCLAFRTHNLDSKSSFQVQVTICAHEVGAREKSPYDSYSYDNIPASSLPHIIRIRTGNVLFNYKYYNNTLQKTEVTEDFSCPFCLVQCTSFKGLRCHCCSCHDLFNFEFWVTEEYQTVNVSVRTDVWRSEVVSDGFDPRLQTFFYRSKFKRPRKSKNAVQNVNHVHPHVLEVDSPETTQHSADYLQDAGISSSHGPLRYPTQCEMEVPIEWMMGLPRHCSMIRSCFLPGINLKAMAQITILMRNVQNLCHPALILQDCAVLQLMVLQVMSMFSRYLEAILHPLLFCNLPRHGNYLLNGLILETVSFCRNANSFTLIEPRQSIVALFTTMIAVHPPYHLFCPLLLLLLQ